MAEESYEGEVDVASEGTRGDDVPAHHGGGGHSADQVAKKMRDADVGAVIVTREHDTIGIISDRDIVVRALAADGSAGFRPVDDVCSSDVVSVEPDTDADDAVDLMRRHAIRRLPVVEGGRPVRIFAIGDMAIERGRDSALGEISAAPPNT